jgi:hypothetical protein
VEGNQGERPLRSEDTPAAVAAMKNAKCKGTRNEHRSRLLLEAAGYAVTRAAASLGARDLVGVARARCF